MMRQRWQDWGNLVLAVWLFSTPWTIATEGAAATITVNALVLGVIIGIVAIWALATPAAVAPEWLNAFFGAWTFVTPWALRFTSRADAWNAWLVGALVLVLALWALGEETRHHRGAPV